MSTTALASAPVGNNFDQQAPNQTVRVLDVAVIIVTYKSARLTVENLKSLLPERSTPGLRVRAVVVDNDSGDLPEIASAVEKYDWSSWVTLVAAPVNGGFGYGNNRGIERACDRGMPSYIHLLNPDTQIRPGAIRSLAQFLETHPKAGIAGSSFEMGDGSDWHIAFRFPSLISELNQGLGLGIVTRLLQPWITVMHMSDSNQAVDWISGASMMIRPDVFKAIGGMDENYFLYFEETDFCRRAQRAGFTTWYVPESRVMHIGGQSTAVLQNSRGRLPSYWFESRRRYFAMSFGICRAIVIDIVAMAANILGLIKLVIQGRLHIAIPHYGRDLLRHSIIWTRNRNVPPTRSGIKVT
jgi:N-acetylglucosaminyl-diphospho-decaprenol L-rhamnosyltransferase